MIKRLKEPLHRLDEICRDVVELTDKAGQFILTESKHFSPSKIQKKGYNDLVSYVDKESEKMILKGLLKIIHGSAIIAEESGEHKGSAYTWVVDPLDGTTNFIHSIPVFAISIALLHEGKTVLGVVKELNRNECFTAIKGKGAKLNNKKIAVSQVSKLNNSLIATGFPYNDFKLHKEYMALFEYLMKHTQGIRRLGSAAADLCYVACGRFEAFYEYGLNPWDVAAGALIMQEAGGIVSDFGQGDNYLFGKTILASNNKIYNELERAIGKYFDGKYLK
jgi:myo-inositol-1(or 4)-monophosphatase